MRKRRIKYFGFFMANDGNTYNREPYEFTSLKTAKKTMRSIALGNVFPGNKGWYRIETIGSSAYDEPVFRGDVRKNK